MQIGPLTFPAVLDDISEPLGDGVDQVGAVIVAAERRARQLDLKLSVRGEDDDPDALATGLRLRRQVRELMENVEWRKLALPVTWDVDPDIDVWLTLGTGDIGEAQAGLTFGEFTLQLAGYIVGRPGSHRAARRLDLADRRTGLTARDTLGMIYSTDFAEHVALTYPLVVPGDTLSLIGTAGPPTALDEGPTVSGRKLWRAAGAIDGEVVSYIPDPDAIAEPQGRHAQLDEPGAVRVWDTITDGLPTGADAAGDLAPDEHYGWERVLGKTLTADRPLGLDNGACRVIYNEPGLLVVQRWTVAGYETVAAISHFPVIAETAVIELTPERACIEYRADDADADRVMRVILQRGWAGPRVESFRLDPTETAYLEIGKVGLTRVASAFSWIYTLQESATDVMRFAVSHEDVTVDDDFEYVTDATRCHAPRALAIQITCGDEMLTAEQLGSLSLADARSVPVLIER